MTALSSLAWSLPHAGDAVEALAARTALVGAAAPGAAPVLDAPPRDRTQLAQAIDAHARRLGIEAEEVSVRRGETLALLHRGGPALILLPGQPGQLLAIAGRSRRRIALVAPDGQLHRVSTETIRAALDERTPNGADSAAARIVSRAGVPARERTRARALLEHDSVSHGSGTDGVWLLRMRPGADARGAWRRHHVPRQLARVAAAHVLQLVLWVAAWGVLGRVALGEGAELALLAAWALLLLALPPIRVWIGVAAARLSIGGGAWLKRRLLAGALRLRPEEVRHQGAGQLFGRVSESEALESLGVAGGALAALATIELLVSAVVLQAGAGGALSVAVLAATMVTTVLLALRYRRLRAEWTGRRLAMTSALVEKMVGRRTVAAQLERSQWHDGEDETLAGYVEASRVMDATGAVLIAGVPRAQLVAGIAALAPAFAEGASAASLAIGVGGTLLAHEAIARITLALTQVTGAVVAWREAAPLYDAAARPLRATDAPVLGGMAQLSSDRVIVADALTYRHEGRDQGTLRGASLTVARGERVVLEGESGAGKSTLAAILGGLRTPQGGVLLVGGLDRHTLDGDIWRRRVVVVPQFHENHVFSGTLAFNLLMGRGWPPLPGDLERAEAICRELALGALLDRMPSGMQQTIGESGWQLSHGERSRLFVARALLQEPDLVVLDESLAALDPEASGKVMDCVMARPGAVLMIAHR